MADVEHARSLVEAAVSANPVAAATLDRLLRLTAPSSIADGLVAESLAYSALLAGHEFARWLADRSSPQISSPLVPAVLLNRYGDQLRVTLNRPERHNAFNRWIRDGMVDALDLVNIDTSIADVLITGAGPSFCSRAT